MVRKRFYNIEELSIILGKSIAAVHGHLARKQYDAVPPPIKLGRRLAWLVESVDAWIDDKAAQAEATAATNAEHSNAPRRRRGRPTKAEQKARSGK
ncbi:helix-turn-helix transcriptional regulator [Oceanidesulfovibrio marinus]|uniref:Transcriptional regulator n=1 Tax=Oceanidesulfovibrio marinus TaxID=370038 RepID=A0ABX6NFV4_9BACT|nr:transcriptional regulator [Oceanidesulfovibrio marinus]QJT09510.1 transcriptional regulator [Oceanidesulfovibrio marinus]